MHGSKLSGQWLLVSSRHTQLLLRSREVQGLELWPSQFLGLSWNGLGDEGCRHLAGTPEAPARRHRPLWYLSKSQPICLTVIGYLQTLSCFSRKHGEGFFRWVHLNCSHESHYKVSLQGIIIMKVNARSHCKESLQGVIARSHCKESLQGVMARIATCT